MKPTQEQVEQALQTLEDAGYAVRSLWSIRDVDFALKELDLPANTITDEVKMEILQVVLESDVICNDISDGIFNETMDRTL